MDYTKGKWERQGNKIKVFNQGTIAICPSPTNNEGVWDFVVNAQLIASAPDIYEALKATRWAIENRNIPMGINYAQLLADINQALAKAEGK